MTFLETYGKEIVALLVPLLTWALNIVLPGESSALSRQPTHVHILGPGPVARSAGEPDRAEPDCPHPLPDCVERW